MRGRSCAELCTTLSDCTVHNYIHRRPIGVTDAHWEKGATLTKNRDTKVERVDGTTKRTNGYIIVRSVTTMIRNDPWRNMSPIHFTAHVLSYRTRWRDSRSWFVPRPPRDATVCRSSSFGHQVRSARSDGREVLERAAREQTARLWAAVGARVASRDVWQQHRARCRAGILHTNTNTSQKPWRGETRTWCK